MVITMRPACRRCRGPMFLYRAIGSWDTDERFCLQCGAREYPDALAQSAGVAERSDRGERYARSLAAGRAARGAP